MAPRVGVGVAEHHHGELLQGAVQRGGELVSCLITLPGRGGGSRARFFAAEMATGSRGAAGGDCAPGGGGVSGGGWVPGGGWVSGGGWVPGGEGSRCDSRGLLEVVPGWKLKARRAALLALEAIGAPAVGRLEVECSVATGVGLGSSTCDVVASIRAVGAAHGVAFDATTVARLAAEAEGAVDPIMFEGEMVLFAQRQGRVLESFGPWIPGYAVLSLDADPDAGGVDTLGLPLPSYTDAELDAFERLVSRARDAFRAGDPAALAAIATESAALNQRFLPLRHFDELRRLAEECGALGLQISHSGTIAGLLFQPARVVADESLEARVCGALRLMGAQPLGLFMTGVPPSAIDAMD